MVTFFVVWTVYIASQDGYLDIAPETDDHYGTFEITLDFTYLSQGCGGFYTPIVLIRVCKPITATSSQTVDYVLTGNKAIYPLSIFFDSPTADCTIENVIFQSAYYPAALLSNIIVDPVDQSISIQNSDQSLADDYSIVIDAS